MTQNYPGLTRDIIYPYHDGISNRNPSSWEKKIRLGQIVYTVATASLRGDERRQGIQWHGMYRYLAEYQHVNS